MRKGLRSVALAFALLCLVLPALHAAAAPRRPMVLVFPVASLGQPSVGLASPTNAEPAPTITRPPAKPATPDADQTLLAARAVRERLTADGTVDALLYASDSPTFVRTIGENKLSIHAEEPTPEDRLTLAKALGAVYVLAVIAPPAPEGGTTIEVQATEVSSRKGWATRATATVRGPLVQPPGTPLSPFPNDVLSAANTVVMKFLGGPLKDYTENTPPPNLLPPAAPPPALPSVRPRAGGDPAAQTALTQGRALLEAGDVNGAIVALREAVNLAPRSGAARTELARAYLKAGRANDAIGEARRGMTIVPASDTNGRVALTRLLAEALSANGDSRAARVTYEEIVGAQPRANWARLALADLYLTENRIADAEAQYRAIRKTDPQNTDAVQRLARLQAARGDYAAAMEELSGLQANASTRYDIAHDLFDSGAATLMATVSQNRTLWEDGRIGRDVLFKATSAQADRVASLLALLRSAAPKEEGAGGSTGDARLQGYRRRVLAASLLAQATASLLTFLETNETSAGAQANVLLEEARKELAQARALDARASGAAGAAGGVASPAP